ncbi:hypothetical protein EYF80_047230 [Liparis tanakae]|uniref:Uncharacterized protein n=1 Tax=Liparis tanakae TaxID=230148 RepID=A0A4Z2FNG1_9TELE|nr:hypothetical protein EYF80_047230 [Liparis tanakae]
MQGSDVTQRREGAGQQELVLLGVQMDHTVPDWERGVSPGMTSYPTAPCGRSLTCSDHSRVSVSFMSKVSSKTTTLGVEGSQQRAVPRCIMGGDGSLEGVSPNRRTAGSHLEGRQLVHTWNTPGVRLRS